MKILKMCLRLRCRWPYNSKVQINIDFIEENKGFIMDNVFYV